MVLRKCLAGKSVLLAFVNSCYLYHCRSPLVGQSPRIMATPLSEKYKMIRIGSPVILQCEVSDPAAQVSWFKDEVELFSKTGLDMKRDGAFRKLIIHSAKISDSGLYSCSLADEAVTFHVDIEGDFLELISDRFSIHLATCLHKLLRIKSINERTFFANT